MKELISQSAAAHKTVPLAEHGALDFGELERLGIDPQAVLDFSVNSNPYGPPPGLREALNNVALERYPDREALALRRALAAHIGVEPNSVVAGNGTAELILALGLAFLRPNDRVVIAGPTFGEYERACRLAGAQVVQVDARAQDAFAPNPALLVEALVDARMLFVCRPNNPTGALLELDALAGWAKRFPRCLFVVDEAYLAFARGCQSALSLNAENVLVLRSMTKDYALAGLRLGYAVAEAELCAAVTRVLPPWNVNALAQAAGVAVLNDTTFLRTLDSLAGDSAHLVRDLTALGYQPCPSAVHYFVMDVGNGAAFRSKLLGRGILVRDCASFGLPAYVRIAAKRPFENERLLAALREMGVSHAR